MDWKRISIVALSILLFSGKLSVLAAPITGNGTSTFVCVYTGAKTVTGFSNFTFNNVRGLFTVNATSSLKNLTFTSAIGSSLNVSTVAFANASGTSISVTGYGAFPTLNSTNAIIANISSTNITATGYITAGTPIGITSGGTGATTATGARTSLGAAASGANSDITSLAGLPDYSARAYSSVSIPTPSASMPISTWDLLPLNTKEYDASNSYNTSTHVYTAPVSGTYSAIAQARWNGSSPGYLYMTAVVKNSSPAECYQRSYSASDIVVIATPCILKLNAGDTAEAMVYFTDPNPRAFDFGRADTYFVITRLGN